MNGLFGVDTHCHIDLYPDPKAQLEKARAAAISVVAVTNTPSVFRHMTGLAAGYSNLYPAIGFHPELAAQRSIELGMFRELAHEAVFIGEVGLDGTVGDASIRRQQRKVFSEVLATCRILGGKILTVHSRRAAGEVLEMIGSGFPCTVILHWFTGSQSVAREALDRGMYFSVNPAMLRSQSGAALVATIPRERILTETDGPFVKIGQRPAEPHDVISSIRKLATAWHLTAEEAGELVLDNFNNCLRKANS